MVPEVNALPYLPILVVIGYFVFLILFALFSIYAVHHLNEYGYSGDASQYMLRLYIGFTSVVLMATIIGVSIGIIGR